MDGDIESAKRICEEDSEENAGCKKPEDKVYTVGAFAKLTGVTERTLRFYHKKGLLEPSGYNELGHRLYTGRDLIRLQQILTLKFLDYPLERIARELEAEGGELKQSLERQRTLLRGKKEQLDRMLHTLDYTLELAEDGETDIWDAEILLLMIQSVSTEREQRRWVRERLPASLTEMFLPEEDSTGKWQAFERESMQWISRIKKLMREGVPPEDPRVRQFALDLMLRIGGVMSKLERPLSKDELRKLEALGRMEPPYPFSFPVTFTADEERYLERVWELAAEAAEAMENGQPLPESDRTEAENEGGAEHERR
ncbi:MerR family transcriptional regulator [Saccharibacillus sp. CPCC 101409]|uniref:MerR family transcriptional regulator n=1 Tax=Saccharibacillus sp. CPCC 101409 TaxID=3058041 RepID=UPI0026735DFF|nr:MerR family transcriptional regulator [Saccharibacillus sp. CPCC 101409]MDO3411259.1 MerR family transcriptional regulator [Saccharibacillus sp. CPCC 101409]